MMLTAQALPRIASLCLLICCSLALVGCSAEEEETAPPLAVERLVLRSLGEQAPALEPTSIHKFEIQGEQLPDWRITGGKGEPRISTLGGQKAALIILGEARKRVEIRGDFQAGSFNQVILEMASHGYENVGLAFFHGKQRILGARGQRVFTERELTRVIFDLPKMRRSKKATNRIVISFAGRTPLISLRSVELVMRPWSRWLPTAEESPELVEVDGEARRAQGLSSEHPVMCEFEAPEHGRLRFGYGMPEHLRTVTGTCQLRFALQPLEPATQGTKNDILLTRDYDMAPGTAWLDRVIDLSPYAGQRLRATFRLVGSNDQEFLIALSEPRLVRPDPAAPVVILITSDTHRGDYLGLAKNAANVKTPFLDSLARKGLFFEDCTSSANVTRPSHAALMTGTSPRDTGVHSNHALLGEAAPTLAESFRAAGWTTYAAVSAEPLNHARSGLGQGFDRVSSPEFLQRDSIETLARLQPWLNGTQGEPLFIWLHLFDAHAPYIVPPEYEELYWDGEQDPRDESRPPLSDYQQPHWDPTLRDLDYIRAQYASEVTYLDERLRILFEHPRLADPIVAVTADHGEHLGGHGLFFVHAELYPATIHIPLIMSWPGAPTGQRISHPVRQIDVGRTLLNLADLGAAPFPGHDLSVVDEERARAPRFVLSADALSSAVLFQEMMLILCLRQRDADYEQGFQPPLPHTVELYDLADDPDCLKDISKTRPEDARKMRALLTNWLSNPAPDNWMVAQASHDAKALEDLAALGYTTVERGDDDASLFDAGCDCARCAVFER